MRIKGKLFSIVLLLCFAVAILTVGVWAITEADFKMKGSIEYFAPIYYVSEAGESADFRFDLYPDTMEATLAECTNKEIVNAEIPGSIRVTGTKNEYIVTYITDFAFYGCNNLTSVEIPLGITGIGAAFYGCANLTSITIPASVEGLDHIAFDQCSSLETITIDSEFVAGDSFSLDGLLRNPETNIVYVKNNSDGSEMYVDSRLTDDFTKSSTTDKEGYTKYKRSYFVTEEGMGDGYTFLLDSQTMQASLIECTDKGREIVVIPAEVRVRGPEDVYTVTTIRSFAFNEGYMTSIEIPASVETIEWQAFYGCANLTSITIPASVISVGAGAFENCSSLETVIIDSEIVAGDTSSLAGLINGAAAIKNVYVKNNDDGTQIEVGAYLSNNFDKSLATDKEGYTKYTRYPVNEHGESDEFLFSLDSVNMEASLVLCIDRSIVNAEIPSKVRVSGAEGVYTVIHIQDYAFSDCSSLTSITIPTSIISIGRAFRQCTNLTSVTIPQGVVSINSEAFSGCSNLTSVEIPSSVTYIGDYAFSGCSNLTSITIPASVEIINGMAFDGCSSLETVIIDSERVAGDSMSLDELLRNSETNTVYVKNYSDGTPMYVSYQLTDYFMQVSTDKQGYTKYTRS